MRSRGALLAVAFVVIFLASGARMLVVSVVGFVIVLSLLEGWAWACKKSRGERW